MGIPLDVGQRQAVVELVVEPALDGHFVVVVVHCVDVSGCPGVLFDASRLPPGVGRPEAFSCLVLSLQTLSFTLGCAGPAPPICFLAGRRARTRAKLCEGYEGSLKKAPDRFYAESEAAKTLPLRRHAHRILAVITGLRNSGNERNWRYRRRRTATRIRKSRHRFPAWHKAAAFHV